MAEKKNNKKDRKERSNFTETDVINIIKKLHPPTDKEGAYASDFKTREENRIGATKSDLCWSKDDDTGKEKNFSERAVMNLLARLDDVETSNPVILAGQPVHIRIARKRIRNKDLKKVDSHAEVDKRTYYVSPTSVHPVFLQMGITQVYVILSALAYKSHNAEFSAVSLQLGKYIYDQLSEYAKKRILNVFGEFDSDLKMFIDEIDKPTIGSDDETSIFYHGFVNDRDFIKSDELELEEISMLMEKLKR